MARDGEIKVWDMYKKRYFPRIHFGGGLKSIIEPAPCLKVSLFNGIVAGVVGSFIGFAYYNNWSKALRTGGSGSFFLVFMVTGLTCLKDQYKQ